MVAFLQLVPLPFPDTSFLCEHTARSHRIGVTAFVADQATNMCEIKVCQVNDKCTCDSGVPQP